MSSSSGNPPPHGLPSTTKQNLPTKLGYAYWKSLFPFLTWIRQYNSAWLASDLIAGVTVGAIVVPQGMAYASLAGLDAQFGLYSSFVGVATYWLFGTSKDISIGPVAVLSTVVGNLVHAVQASDPTISPYAVAASLSIITGSIVLLMGLLQWGWIVNLVSVPSLAAFMTGSAITIATSQMPALLGLTGFSNRDAPYKVTMNIVLCLNEANINACLGLTALFILYLVRFLTTTVAERLHKHRRTLHLLNSMRAVAVIVIYTFISWLAHYDAPQTPLFDVLGDIPRGFQHLGLPPVETSTLTAIMPYLPATIAVMLVEHMAIAKSFGRQNGYTIDASQEMMAIGATNLLGPFFGGYASTGSFSRTAIQSKSGARTPMTGVITALVVLMAVQVLTAAFYYIPTAVLSAVVVHAVGDLITSWDTVQQFWRVSPMEAIVFLVGVAVSILQSIETGLYVSVAVSTVALLYRSWAASSSAPRQTESRKEQSEEESFEEPGKRNKEAGSRGEMYPSGVLNYQLPASFNYINSAATVEDVLSLLGEHTHQDSCKPSVAPGEQSWSAGTTGSKLGDERVDLSFPPLTAVTLDFASMRDIDVTAVQKLADLKKQVNAHAASRTIKWHMSHVVSAQVQRALLVAELVPVTEAIEGADQSNRVCVCTIGMTDVRRPLLADREGAGDEASAETSGGAIYGSV